MYKSFWECEVPAFFRVLSVLLSRVENLFYYDYVAKTTEFQKCIS